MNDQPENKQENGHCADCGRPCTEVDLVEGEYGRYFLCHLCECEQYGR